MAFEDYLIKDSVVVVYTGEGKGKTSAAVGMLARALGAGQKVAFVQFIKHWQVSEHDFFEKIGPAFGSQFVFHKGGKGFYKAGTLSAKGITESGHKKAALETFKFALSCAESGKFDLVICDEINNAVSDGLLSEEQLLKLIEIRAQTTSLCLTGRNFPEKLLEKVDIATHMTKMKHHFDEKFLANKGIDF